MERKRGTVEGHSGAELDSTGDEPLPGEQPRQEEPPPADSVAEAPLTSPDDTHGG